MKGWKHFNSHRTLTRSHFSPPASGKILKFSPLKLHNYFLWKIIALSIFCQRWLNMRKILMLCVHNLCSISRILKWNKNGMFNSICGNKQIIFGNYFIFILCLIVAVSLQFGRKKKRCPLRGWEEKRFNASSLWFSFFTPSHIQFAFRR